MDPAATCTACGQANPSAAKFCNECGAPLAQQAGQEVRKTLTVLFADLVGFTSLGERLDQESLRRVMDRFYEEMRGAVHAHGGTVAKFIGDAVMAVWGTPVVREDDALRAVRAAEEMRRALAALNVDLDQRWGVKVGMRTGVNTGEVVVDPTKPADLLVGDTLNIAARLEQASADGEVLVGPETYRLVRSLATLEPVEPLQLKGKTRRLPAYRLLDGHRPERRQAERLRAPCVGRDAELDRLRAAFDAAVAARETRLVTVIGSPGVGKSRLTDELTARLADDARVLRGHCEPVTEGATFLPVAEVVREAADLGDAAGDDLRARLAAVVPGEDDERVLDGIAALLGAGRPMAAEETFWAVRRFLEALAAEHPLVVVLDDVHWGEPTFLDLVEHLAGWGRDAPILLVALARPELRDVRAALCEGDALSLEPLPPDASRALVDGLLGAADLPEPLAERLLETADGNPLFLGEMLRMLVDDGVLRREGDTWVVAHAEQVSVPPTINALLAARLERLPTAERVVAERAAVIGPLFSRDAVAELAGDELAAEIDEHLDALRRKELITSAPGPADDASYRFGHALIRDAAYRPLLKEARAELHERFAAWLEARGAEQDEIVGFHLERAYGYLRELGPLDDRALDVGRRAGEHLGAAGRAALDREDLPAATNLLTRALHVMPEDAPERPQVLLDLAEALLSAGDTAAGGEVVEELALRAEAAGDERLQALATVFGGQLAGMVGAGGVRETIALLEHSAATLAAAEDRRGEAKAHHVVAGAHALLGEVAAAESALDRALVAARAAGDRRRVTAVLSGAPRAALWGPSPVVRASGRCLDVVRIVRMTPGNRHVETMALRCQAVLEAMRGRADAGRAILRDGRAVLEELGLTLELHELDMHAGIVHLLAGEPAEAEAHLRAAREGFLALGVDTGAAQASALLGRAVLEQARDDEAVALTEFAEARGGEDLKTAIAWRGVRAEALARRGEHEEAERLARDAVALVEPTDALTDKADALMVLAEVLRARGDAGGAREAAGRAREVYAAKEHEVGAGRAAAAAGGPAPARRAETPDAELGDSVSERIGLEWLRCVNARDWDGLRQLYAEDVELVDHQPEGAHIKGADALIEALRSPLDLAPEGRWRAAKILAASDHVNAWVGEFRAPSVAGGGPMTLAVGQVTTYEGGRIERIEMFDPADEPAMLARFEEVRAAHDGTTLERLLAESIRCLNDRDWEAMRRIYHRDYRVVDHRPSGVDMDREQTFAAWEESHRLVRDVRWSRTRVLALSDHVAASVLQISGRMGEGGPVELAYGNVNYERDGLIVGSELFDPDDVEAILARFEELRAETERGGPAPGVSRDGAAVAASLAQVEAFNARDWDAYRALFAPGYSAVDRRAVGWGEDLDGDAAIETARTAVEMAADLRSSHEILAATNDVAARILTMRGTANEGGGEFEARFGSVVVVEDGRATHIEIFDPDDREAILARFEELSAENDTVRLAPGVDPADAGVALLRTTWERLNARDWAGYDALFAPEYTATDHRTLGWGGRMHRGAVLEVAQTAVAVAPDVRAHSEVLAAADGVVAHVVTFRGHSSAGGDGEIDVSMGAVFTHADGLSVESELFAPEDRDAMLARFEELRRPATRVAPGVDPEHPVVRLWAAIADAANRRDWDGFGALFAEDYVGIDNRRIGWGPTERRAAIVDLMRSSFSGIHDGRLSAEILAVDENLSLRIMRFDGHARSGGAFEHVQMTVAAYRDGVTVREEHFELEDVDAARTLFEELSAADDPVGLAPGVDPEHPAVAATRAQCHAFNRRDWEAVRALFAPGYEAFDRRAVGWERLDLDRLIETGHTAVAAVPDMTTTAELLACGAAVTARIQHYRGHAADGGGLLDVSQGEVAVYDDEGRIAREEFFDADDRESLMARYEELRSESESPAVAARRRFTAAFEARDWEALGAQVAPDALVVDRRPLGFGEVRGRSAVAQLASGLAEVGADRWGTTPLATRGGRLALFAERVSGAEASGEACVLIQLDADGHIGRDETFSREDEAAARERLEALAAFAAANQILMRAVDDRDWDAMAAAVSPDVVYDYHPGGRRFEGREAMLAQLRAMFDPSERLSCAMDRLDVTPEGVRHRRETWRGADRAGSAWELVVETIALVDASGSATRLETFLAGDPRIREAIARLAAAASSPA